LLKRVQAHSLDNVFHVSIGKTAILKMQMLQLLVFYQAITKYLKTICLNPFIVDVKFLDAGVFLKHAKKQFCEELIW
jgi:hypothetical protein